METERHISSDLTFGAFLSENAEAFGLISDAHPITTPTLMIAANGHAADDGMSPPAFSVSAKGVDGLYDVLYHSLIRRSADNEEILRLTFGESEGRQTHPIARYCAALTVALAKQTLADMEGEDGDTCAQTLSAVLPDGIDALRDVMRAAVGPRPGSEHFFSVSFAACRVTSRGQGVYDLDVFHAGDFSLYIFDEHGMVPLYVCDSDVLEPVDSSFVSVEHIRLEHSEPFALFLLSKSVFDLSTKDFRAMQERPGMIWRYRMRLEDQLIRLVTSAGREDELPERAQRFFAGRAVGRDSASGAWLFLNGTFDAFKTVCRGRLHHLERLISLLPKGYDSIHPVEQTPLEQAEKAFVLAAFRTRPGLTERTMDAIVKRAEWLLREGKDTADGENALEQDGSYRLTYDVVRDIFLSFDEKNQADRQQIEKNRKVMLDLLSEHWTTLRPIFCRPPMMDAVAEDVKVKSDSAATTCVALKCRIAYLVGKRRQTIEDIRARMQDSLDVLLLQGSDWVSGVGGDGSAYEWFRDSGDRLSRLVAEARDDYAKTTDRLRGLQAAYTQERALSFSLDIAEGGLWHTYCRQMMDGELPADIWRVYANDIQELAPGYEDFLQVLRTVSERNLALRQRIDGRGAERRALLTLSGDENWQVACMLGALREDASWGDQIHNLVDNGFRNEYKTLRRRWMEEKELIICQREAFEDYRRSYTAYTADTDQ